MGASGTQYNRLSDSDVPNAFQDQSGRGAQSEQLILTSGNFHSDGTVDYFTPSSIFVDTATVWVPSRFRTLLIVIGTAVTFAGAQQIKVQLVSTRKAVATRSGATSAYPDGPNEGNVLGSAVNLGPNAASIPPGAYFFTPQELPQLQWPLEYVGAEINFVAVPTGGLVYALFLSDPI